LESPRDLSIVKRDATAVGEHPATAATLADELLVVRCQLGEGHAFEELVARWHVPLWRYLYRVTGDDHAAGDCLQEVWVRVWRGLARLRDGGKLRAWLFGIARRVLMDRLRDKYASARLEPLDDVEAVTLAAAPPVTEEGDLDVLETELANMPVVEREVLVLFYLKELSLAELAEILDIPLGTVKSRLFRARGMLRERVTARGVSR
jgi:RNA polymerase sigma factor (sigma-70 family)